jgi:hypothetical protein
MTIPYTGAGGIFTRLGYAAQIELSINQSRGTTVPALVNALAADLATNDPIDAAALEAALVTYQSGATGLLNQLKSLAINVVVNGVNTSIPQPNSTFLTAMQALISAMQAGNQSVQRCVVAATVAAGSANAGNPVIVASALNGSGLPQEDQFSEVIKGTCQADSQTGTAVSLREPVLFLGAAAVVDTLSYLYPAGSGCSTKITAVDALQNQAGGLGNLLNNGSFESFLTTPNLPDDWHAIVGTPGTQIFQSTSQSYDGSTSLQITGDGSTAVAIYQGFGNDTTSKLLPLTQYAVVLWARVDVVPASGVLEIALTDGSNNVVADLNNVANLATHPVTALTTIWTPLTAVFRTSRALPISARIRIRTSTSVSSGSNLFLDRVAMASMSPLYLGGPSAAVFSANTPMVVGDSFTITTTNNRGGLIQTACDALLPMRANNLLVPSVVSSPTIPDSLV